MIRAEFRKLFAISLFLAAGEKKQGDDAAEKKPSLGSLMFSGVSLGYLLWPKHTAAREAV